MFLKSKLFRFIICIAIGIAINFLPRPEGTQFEITGDTEKVIFHNINADFTLVSNTKQKQDSYIVEIKGSGPIEKPVKYLKDKSVELGMPNVTIDYVNGLSPTGLRFLALLAALVLLFVIEPIPLEIIAVLIGVSMVVLGITDAKNAWAPYMHPVVVFIMCCLIFAVALDKVGITKRLGFFIIKKGGTSVTRFTFIIAGSLGISSAFLHDAAACAIGIVTMLPLMRASGITPNSSTGKFMMISLPFACSCGGMGSLIGGGRCMVAAAFLKEFTGIEITFFDWILYAMPMAIVTVPISILLVYLVFRPDPNIKLPELEGKPESWTKKEKIALIIFVITFTLWLTKGIHNIDYSVTGMIGVAGLVGTNVLKWDDIHSNLEWGTALFIFGGGLSLGLGMGYSGAGKYLASIFFPLVKGNGWLVLFAGVGLFGALITNAMANVAAAALILPIVIPLAQLEGVDPVIMAMCLGMATSFAMLLVIGCPPNAIAYSYRYFKSSDLTKAGLVATPLLLLILVGMASIWWRIIGLI